MSKNVNHLKYWDIIGNSIVRKMKEGNLKSVLIKKLKKDKEFMLYFLIVTEMKLDKIKEVFDYDKSDLINLMQFNLLKSLCVNPKLKNLYKNDIFNTKKIENFLRDFDFEKLAGREIRLPR